MKLDTRAFRYLDSDDWRVLNAVERGSRNHEVVPTPLIQQIAGLRGQTGVHKCISNLAKVGLIGKVKNARYDGYRLTYGGLDYLALNAHRRSEAIFSLGNQIGVGKESDIYITASPQGRQQVLKLHRLGRISFRTVKANRDYLRNRSTGSWMYLSRLAAQKEHAFMCVLHREGFPVPEPIAWSRHTVVMEFIDSFPLRMIESVPDPGKLYAELMDMIVQLAKRGLIHGDFNEFNILIKEEADGDQIRLKPIMIDFPQTVSTNHVNAQFYFDRDVGGIKRFFERRFKFVSDESGPFFADVLKHTDPKRLDIEVEASGFSKKMGKDLERYVEATGGDDDSNEAGFERHGDLDVEADQENNIGSDEGGDPDAEVAEEDEENDANVSGLTEDVSALSVNPEDFAVKKQYDAASFGLQPLSDSDLISKKVQTEKASSKIKASGWVI